MTRGEIFSAIVCERMAQAEKWNTDHAWGWGDCSTLDVPMIVKVAVLTEEVGEFAQAVLNAGPDKARTDDAVRTELIQVAAVAWAILEGMPA